MASVSNALPRKNGENSCLTSNFRNEQKNLFQKMTRLTRDISYNEWRGDNGKASIFRMKRGKLEKVAAVLPGRLKQFDASDK